jgi:hypothetical protein
LKAGQGLSATGLGQEICAKSLRRPRQGPSADGLGQKICAQSPQRGDAVREPTPLARVIEIEQEPK